MLRLMTLTDTVSPRAEIEDHEGNVINKKTEKFMGKTKEQDKHEENRQDDTEKEDIIDESQENAYRMEIVQKDNSSRNCKKCEVSFKNQEKFRKHLIGGHKKQMHTDIVMIYFI